MTLTTFKNLRINLTKEVEELYNENYKTLTKEIKRHTPQNGKTSMFMD
jgi:hypothetical protein